MVPGHLLLLLFVVALQASGTQAVPWQRLRADVPPERTLPALSRPPAFDPNWHPKIVLVGDEYRVLWPTPPGKPQGDSKDVAVGDGYPAFQLRSSTQHPGNHMDMWFLTSFESFQAKCKTGSLQICPQGRVFQLFRSLLCWIQTGIQELGSTQRARYTARRGKKSQKTSEILDKTVNKLVQVDFDRSAETIQQKGSRQMPPVSDVDRKAMHAASIPEVDIRKSTKAGSDKRLRLYITMSSVVPMMMLSLRLTFLIRKLYQKKKELMKEKEETAPGQANTDTASFGQDQTGEAASREETK